MRKVHIVQGIMSVVGKVGKAVGTFVKECKEVVSDEIKESVEQVEKVVQRVERAIGKLRLKVAIDGQAVGHVQTATSLQSKVIDFQEKVYQKKYGKSSHMSGASYLRGYSQEMQYLLMSYRAKSNPFIKNKEVALPLHRDIIDIHKVIYLHQRAPTYRSQNKLGARKRGTGT